MPQTQQWVTFSKWAKTYGSIVYLEALGQPIVVINFAKIANDLLDQRSAIYSDRPSLTMATLSGCGNSFAIQSYNESFKQQRKIVAQDFGSGAVRRYYPLQETEARKLVHGLLKDPSTLRSQLQLRIGTIILRVTYGHYVTDEHDPFLLRGLEAIQSFSQATAPGAWAIDLLPILRHIPSWVPGAGFHQVAKKYRKAMLDATWRPYVWCKENMVGSTSKLPSFHR
ncbi:cytochrome P450 [Mycena galopus ATCC 62051]|nr:cytochrome P450 [Mycena galopus ATCC 62051]